MVIKILTCTSVSKSDPFSAKGYCRNVFDRLSYLIGLPKSSQYSTNRRPINNIFVTIFPAYRDLGPITVSRTQDTQKFFLIMHLITGSQESNTWERVIRYYYWFRRRLAKLQRRTRHLIAFGNAIFLLQLTWKIHIPTYPCVICSLSFLQRVLQRYGGIKYWTVICEDNQWLYCKFHELQIPLPDWQGKVSEDNKITGS